MGEARGIRRRRLPVRIGAHERLWAGLLLGLPVLAYLWPVLVGGKAFTPMADLYDSVPWTAYAPRGVQQLQNLTLLDLPLVLEPWRILTRELLHQDVLPAWNPYALAGTPLYQNVQSGLFSLFNLPLWIFSITYGLGLSAALKLLAGAIGAYLLVRQLQLGFLPGLLAGVAFAFSSTDVVWLAHAELPGVIVMLPWALLFVERILTGRRAGGAAGLTIATAIALGGGHPGMQVHFLAVTALYALVRAAWPDRDAGAPAPSRAERLRAALLVGGALAAGGLVMAFMLVPEMRLAHGTVGVTARQGGQLPGQRIPLDALQTVVFPDRWGRPSGFEDPAHNPFGLVNYNERTFYAGVVALLFACVGLLVPGGWRRKAPLVLLAVVGLAVPLHAPGLYWAMTHLPVLDLVEAQRIHFAFELAVALLAAFGLEALLGARGGERRQLVVPALALAGGAFALLSAGASGTDLGHLLRHFATGADYASAAVLALTSIAWFLLFAVGVGVLLLLARRRPRWRPALAAVVVVLAAADALHFANGYVPMVPAGRAMPSRTPAIAYLQRHRADGRVAGIAEVLPPDTGTLFGLRDVRGYDPPEPTRRLFALWQLLSPAQQTWTPLEVFASSLAAEGRRLLDVLGARYLVFGAGVRFPPEAPRTLRTAYAGPDATVVENAGAVARAFVPARVLRVSGQAEALARIVEASFDARTTATVEAGSAGRIAAPAGRGAVSLERDANAAVTLRARMERAGLVVLDDALMDGWSVRVDGRPARALYADDVMRGVGVPAGTHRIVWSYAVPGLRLGVTLSLVALAALTTTGVLLRLRRARRARRPGRPSRSGRSRRP